MTKAVPLHLGEFRQGTSPIFTSLTENGSIVFTLGPCQINENILVGWSYNDDDNVMISFVQLTISVVRFDTRTHHVNPELHRAFIEYQASREFEPNYKVLLAY